jgi:hypothetical protein
MKDELKRNFYVKEVSGKYDVYESVLYRELERWITEDKRTHLRERIVDRQAIPERESITHGRSEQQSDIPPEERDILKILMEGDEEITGYITSNIIISDFSNPQVQKVANLVLHHRQTNSYNGVESLIHLVDDPVLKELITGISFSKYELSKGWQTPEKEVFEGDPWQIAKDAILIIKRRAIRNELEENQKSLKDANQKGADSRPFLLRHNELLRQIKELEAVAAQKP